MSGYLTILKKAAYIAIKAAVAYFAPNAASKFISTDNVFSPIVKEATHNIAEKYVEKKALESLEFMASAIAPDVISILSTELAPRFASLFEEKETLNDALVQESNLEVDNLLIQE